jgi:cell division protease FtsH
VTQKDLEDSVDVALAGKQRKSMVISQHEKEIIAYHEVGHALVAAKQKGTEPVSKITIVPHTQGALGYTMQTPEEEKFLNDREELYAEIRTLLGGRAAESVIFNTATTGASNDIERATDLARKMVTLFGMSDTFGVMGLATIRSQYLDGGYGLNCAQDTAAQVDKEVQDILNQCFEAAKNIILENRELMDKIAEYLLQKETITGQEMMAIIEGRDPELVDNYGTNPRFSAKIGEEGIEPAAKKVHMVSEPVEAPELDAPEETDEPETNQADSDSIEEPEAVTEGVPGETAQDAEEPQALTEDAPSTEEEE